MKRILTVILAMLLIMSMSLSASAINVSEATKEKSESGYINERSVKNELSLKQIPSKSASSYRQIALYFNGKALNVDARLINGMTYVSLRFFINAVAPDMSVSYNSRQKTLTVSGEGFNLSATDGSYTVLANGRVLFTVSPSVIMTNTRIYVPISSVTKALGLSIKPGGTRIDISGSISPITDGERFYRDDAVYWLSRIISAESRGESLLGQVAVGNVVLNRVDSPLYPNSIWGVIFDKKYGVQFSPILDGTIYNSPTESSILAAKIALEGYSIDEKVLFFLAPKYAQSSWIPRTRTYEFTIGTHDFYS